MTSESRWPGASPVAAARLDRADPARAGFMREFLKQLANEGCAVEVPEAKRDDYVNIARPPASRQRGRLASMNVRTGRVEFQTDSWNAALSCGAHARADRLPAGNKAAISLIHPEDVNAALAIARAVLSGRTGH